MFYIMSLDDVFKGILVMAVDGTKYAVVDTDDGVIEYYTADEIVSMCRLVWLRNFDYSTQCGFHMESFFDSTEYTFAGKYQYKTEAKYGVLYNENNADIGEYPTSPVTRQRLSPSNIAIRRVTDKNGNEVFRVGYASKLDEIAVFVGEECFYVARCFGFLSLNSFFRVGNYYVYNFVALHNASFGDAEIYAPLRLICTLDMKLEYIWGYFQQETNRLKPAGSFMSKFNIAFDTHPLIRVP